MPFSGTTYSLPSSAFVTHTGIRASPINVDFIDIGNALTTAFLAQLTQGSTQGVGNCRLTAPSTSLLRLLPYNGNGLTINGTVRTIPATGVDLNLSGIASSVYYIYAYWTGTAVALELSTTTRTTEATYGTQVKTGDSSRSLVGYVYLSSTGTTADTPATRYVASWFNPPVRSLQGATFTNQAITDDSFDPTIFNNCNVQFLRFKDRPGWAFLRGVASNNGASGTFARVQNSGALSYFKSNTANVRGPFFADDNVWTVVDLDGTQQVNPRVAVEIFGTTTTASGTLRGWIL